MENGKSGKVILSPAVKAEELKPRLAPDGAVTKPVRAFALGNINIDADTLKWVNADDLLAALQRHGQQDWGEQNPLADRNAKVLAQVPRFDSRLPTKTVVGNYRDRNGERIVITTTFPSPHTDISWEPEIPH